MRINFGRAALGALYLAWVGLGLSAYRAFPDLTAYLYLASAMFFTALLCWFILDRSATIQDEAGSNEAKADELREFVSSVHFCARPRECSRCSGFYWALGPGLLATASTNRYLVQFLDRLPFPPALLLMITSIVFLVSVGGHGVLNGLQKKDEFRYEIPTWMVNNGMKLLLGAVAGISIPVIAASTLLTIEKWL